TLPVPAESSPRLPPPRSNSEPPAIPSEEEQSVTDERLSQLHASTEKARINAALELGRDRVKAAVPALTQVLKEDSSSHVRDAAARALGLIGSARALDALQMAALADDDREVRHSAQFAAEVIRSRLRGR